MTSAANQVFLTSTTPQTPKTPPYNNISINNAMEPLTTPPEASSFVLLADHQSRTPASFHSGPPVLHYHSKACKLVISERDLLSVPVLNAIRGDATSNGNAENGNAEGEGEEVVIDGVDVWVTSEYVLPVLPQSAV